MASLLGTARWLARAEACLGPEPPTGAGRLAWDWYAGSWKVGI